VLNDVLTAACASENTKEEADVLLDLAAVCERDGDNETALTHSRRGLLLYQQLGNAVGEAMALNAVGWYLAQRGDYVSAMTHCRRAIRLQRQLGFTQSEASTWDSLGFVHHRLGQEQESIACYERAIALFRQIDDRFAQARSQQALAAVYEPHDPLAAERIRLEARAILDELDSNTIARPATV
jgi:tetratricopeptide (TPR) repeat protein